MLLALLVAYLGWQAWLSIAAPGKIADFPSGRERANILVTLPFPPERFHVQMFQGFGRVSGTEGNTIEVRNVRRSDFKSVARPYWVQRIEPLKEGG
ncbi:MAG: hypothetical protein JNM30_18025 [Rhodospirillales bacterium]|nr:hypothetical protein [Rhodospirillales bacterium]